jgi:hypothetical protein
MTMPLPDTLPALAYLAMYDRNRGRTVGGWSGHLVSAAAVADLYLGGYVLDDAGTVRPVDGRRAPDDTVLAEVWQRIVDGKARKWQHWANQRGLMGLVRDDLASRWIRVDRPPRFLRRARISVRDPRMLPQLNQLVAATLRGPTPVSRLPERDTMLVALLAVAEVRTVLPRAKRREYSRRIDEMVTRGGPPVDGLRRAIAQSRRAYAAGG